MDFAMTVQGLNWALEQFICLWEATPIFLSLSPPFVVAMIGGIVIMD